MGTLSDETLLWEPSPAVKQQTNITRYMQWLEKAHGLAFDSYETLWHWSVTEIEAFWESIWDYFDIQASKRYTRILNERTMPGAEWFSGAELNYSEHFFRNINQNHPALIYKSESEAYKEISWQELHAHTAAVACALEELGVKTGDRVVAYMPNIPETIIAFLACASIGAIWSCCSPDFGSRSVLDRFQQIEPKVLITVDGYYWNGKVFNRIDVVAELQNSLPTLENTIMVNLFSERSSTFGLKDIISWETLLYNYSFKRPLKFVQVSFNHPLWVLYSSGTTGLPKPIVHGHGGILLEHLKALTFHLDLNAGDRFFWITSTGWMMWNFLIGGLLVGSTVILYNGSPGYPDMDTLWEMAEKTKTTYFGASAAFITACQKAGISPGRRYDLKSIRSIGATGSPLSEEGFRWVYDHIHEQLALESVSGGTDLCTPFVGGCRLLPVYAGEIQCRYLGARVEAYDEAGMSVIDQVGELVITSPMPSMPLFFWNDPDYRRYKNSYFEMFPGIWRHGDWIRINQRGGCVIYGRSDATINRYGIRMGTSEIYQVVEGLEEVVDSLVVDLEGLEQRSYMPLFLVLRQDAKLDEELITKIKTRIQHDISPRHVPDEIFAIDQIPRTLSGKKLEVPVRKILLGYKLDQAVNLDAMSNPESLQFFMDLAAEIQKREH